MEKKGKRPSINKKDSLSLYERHKDLYEEFLQDKGSFSFPKSEARILFKCEERKGLTSDILVAQFKNPGDNRHLYQVWPLDIGNCITEWEDWSLNDVLIKIFVFYGVEEECRLKVLLELSKIEEWRPYLAAWIYAWMK